RASDPQFKAPLLRSPAGHRAFARSSGADVTLRHPWCLAVCSDSGWGLGLRPLRGLGSGDELRRMLVHLGSAVMSRRYRTFASIEDPGPPLRTRIGGRERRVPRLLAPLLAPLKHLRLYRRRRLLPRQVDQFAEIVERELPAGTREFHDGLRVRMHE